MTDEELERLADEVCPRISLLREDVMKILRTVNYLASDTYYNNNTHLIFIATYKDSKRVDHMIHSGQSIDLSMLNMSRLRK